MKAPPKVEELQIQPMRRRHLRKVLRIEQQVYPRPWSLGLYVAELSREHDRVYLVGFDGGRLVGYGGCLLLQEDGHVTTLAVDPEWQGRSVGTRLLIALARQAVARGACNLTLEVRMSNEPAKALYRRFGFVPAGVRRNYYAEVGEDALVMWANDAHALPYQERLACIEAELDDAVARGG